MNEKKERNIGVKYNTNFILSATDQCPSKPTILYR